MLFSQITSFALFFLSVGSVVASPTPGESAIVAREDPNDVVSILEALEGQINIILPEITNLVVSGNANDANITPLITELVSSFSTATTSVGAASLSRRHLKRDTVADVAVLLANIISVMAVTLDDDGFSTTASVPLSSVDVAIDDLLVSVNDSVPGVLVAVEGLLGDVAGILEDLGFTFTTTLLGL